MSTATARRLLAATPTLIAAPASSPGSIGARTRPGADKGCGVLVDAAHPWHSHVPGGNIETGDHWITAQASVSLAVTVLAPSRGSASARSRVACLSASGHEAGPVQRRIAAVGQRAVADADPLALLELSTVNRRRGSLPQQGRLDVHLASPSSLVRAIDSR